MVQGGMTVIRYVTFAFNFIFLICGIALIVVGALAKKEGRDMSLFLGDKLPAASILVIIAGCVVLGLSFLGCCGALKENYCMLMTFSVLLFLLFIIELAAGITGVVFRRKLENEIEKNMKNSMESYGKNKTDVTNQWNTIQKDLECCGVTNYTDWIDALNYIPGSCCPANGTASTCTSTDAYKDGCFKKLEEKIRHYAVQLIVAAFVVAFIQLLGLIFGCCLANAIKKEYETV